MQLYRPTGLDEHTTFEDGSDGHGHTPPGHGKPPAHPAHPAHQSVPEPSVVIGLIAAGVAGFLKRQDIGAFH
ncbi:MAG: PEP-CTERM sorting domain-containing protein [Leptolyngbya sp. SIO4C1]|nr:PEP-CTERM sorting domain-containing protein [Leptolyngbya sp. SIO4C1]